MGDFSGDQHFLCLEAAPAEMDRLWAEGWRHFGILFFRYRISLHGPAKFHVLPLRIDVARFNPSRSQRRVLRNNRDLRVVMRPAAMDAAKQALFNRHRRRFRENVPGSLSEFLSAAPDCMPCPNLELCIYEGARLLGVTFLDIGETATSAVYAIFDPAEARRSPGILMMLHSIGFSRERGYRYYYPGYAYHEPFIYDYKKRFSALEYLDWECGWRPYAAPAARPNAS
jgi:arginine-tRNA-protein transferase